MVSVHGASMHCPLCITEFRQNLRFNCQQQYDLDLHLYRIGHNVMRVCSIIMCTCMYNVQFLMYSHTPLIAHEGAPCGGVEVDGSPLSRSFFATNPVKSFEPF